MTDRPNPLLEQYYLSKHGASQLMIDGKLVGKEDVAAALRGLEPMWRVIAYMKYFHHATNSQMAVYVGVSRGTFQRLWKKKVLQPLQDYFGGKKEK